MTKKKGGGKPVLRPLAITFLIFVGFQKFLMFLNPGDLSVQTPPYFPKMEKCRNFYGHDDP